MGARDGDQFPSLEFAYCPYKRFAVCACFGLNFVKWKCNTHVTLEAFKLVANSQPEKSISNLNSGPESFGIQ